MKSTILVELPYCGSIQYYTKLLKYSTVCIEQYENYRKGSFRNRCQIISANGIMALTIPLTKGKHQQAAIREVLIDNNQDWKTQHWRSIQTAYGGSPYFDYYKDDFIELYQKKHLFLFDFCLDVQELILQNLQLQPTICFSNSYQKELADNCIDFRNNSLPKNYQQAQDTCFYPEYYPQVFEYKHGFVQNLSILDLLFCTGPEAIYYLQKSIRD